MIWCNSFGGVWMLKMKQSHSDWFFEVAAIRQEGRVVDRVRDSWDSSGRRLSFRVRLTRKRQSSLIDQKSSVKILNERKISCAERNDQRLLAEVRRIVFSIIAAAMALLALFLGPERVSAFSLLGPYESWMQMSNDFRWPQDPIYDSSTIGGPMCLSNEYRWNVPVVTYGFDRSFVDFFGSNGVAAVEAAIGILNRLPTASSIVTTNYPLFSEVESPQDGGLSLLDLKSQTLSLLLEQLGLDSPTRYIYIARNWTNSELNPAYETDVNGAAGFNIANRNYDPETLESSTSVDGFDWGFDIVNLIDIGVPALAPVPYQKDVSQPAFYRAVADNILPTGYFYAELTADDVGGLRYLLSSNNVNFETLLPGISASDGGTLVDGAWRPGVEKVTFARQPCDSENGQFLPFTNQYTDIFVTNGVVARQQLQRVTSQPDFLFSAGDTFTESLFASFFSRTGTSNWINNAMLNGKAAGAGPGVIAPPIRITFAKLGRYFYSQASENGSETNVEEYTTFWGSFDDSTNAPVIYPAPRSGSNELVIHLQLQFDAEPEGYGKGFQWDIPSQSGKVFRLETSTNLVDWNLLGAIQNDGSICRYIDFQPSSIQRFYRIVPQ